MPFSRRDFITTIAAGTATFMLPACALLGGDETMYGLIGKMRATPGQRDAVISILLEGIANMPGCLSYIVAQDPSDPDAIWITEVWDSENSHQTSLSLPSVQDAISRAKPLIAGFDEHIKTIPVGGHGIGDAA